MFLLLEVFRAFNHFEFPLIWLFILAGDFFGKLMGLKWRQGFNVDGGFPHLFVKNINGVKCNGHVLSFAAGRTDDFSSENA